MHVLTRAHMKEGDDCVLLVLDSQIMFEERALRNMIISICLLYRTVCVLLVFGHKHYYVIHIKEEIALQYKEYWILGIQMSFFLIWY